MQTKGKNTEIFITVEKYKLRSFPLQQIHLLYKGIQRQNIVTWSAARQKTLDSNC